ncbi:MAG TPA: alanine--tRNA ligase [Candidatus Latescibacteria bacterium]|nr:alanine--tRNA ligase [Candidatus Latescibacterota bacterium]
MELATPKTLTSAEQVRRDFLEFFESKQHTIVPSAPVAPQDDPTLLFTNAGMNQFKDVFLGTGRRDYTRAADTQKCIRVSGKHNDLEEVGHSPGHHTFFEMLGNWSFGDYYKREAIEWAWELLTQVWQLPKERLWATVFGGDEADGFEADTEAESLWYEVTDIFQGRVLRLGKKDNFWEMGEIGPCGPCSEIHFYTGSDPSSQSTEPDLDGPDYLELWNLVFIQYNRGESGDLQTLPNKHVDTGMGFERICSVLQGVGSNYETDLFQPIIVAVSEITRQPYNADNKVAIQVIGDHIRSLAFSIADGALPSNEGRGYVLRRILRRAARYGRTLGMQEPFIHELAETIAEVMGDSFPEVRAKRDHIERVIRSEEEGFNKTLDRGLEIFESVSASGSISGEDAFQLYDTYGFPIDLTELMAAEKGIKVDTTGFERAMEEQKNRSREATRKAGGAQQALGEGFLPERHSEFVGYDTLTASTKVVAIQEMQGGKQTVFLEETPFYAESGGQIGDRGSIHANGCVFLVENTYKNGESIVHEGEMETGSLPELNGQTVDAKVDESLRLDTARNHTLTHLVHAALREELGTHVHQAGSYVGPDRMRFDFTHMEPVSEEVLNRIESRVNEMIRENMAVEIAFASLDSAKEMGAMMLFSEKYGETVRTVRIGHYSLELCGGTHLSTTGQAGLVRFTSETGTAAGVRRLEAVSGRCAEQLVKGESSLIATLSTLLGTDQERLTGRVEHLVERNKELEREVASVRKKSAGSVVDGLISNATALGEIRITTGAVDVADMDSFRSMADKLREGLKDQGVGVIGASLSGKASLIAVVTDDLISRGVHAGNIVRDVAKVVGGGGGGKPHLAQAGGKDPERIPDALSKVADIVRGMVEG